ncbi:MAG: G1 family glutamic endopeptidase [Actinomycetota bacterium]
MRRSALTCLTIILCAFVSDGTQVATASHGVRLSMNGYRSYNWSGYNQGRSEKGHDFHAISGEWTVPTATAHKQGVAAYSSIWVGIGGGCVDSACNTIDSTLIQAGTEQDVDANGTATYSTWWETLPAPSVKTTVAVSPGDKVRVDVSETISGVWTITIDNLTTNSSLPIVLPFQSSYATAEWIVETPTVTNLNGSQVGPLPNLGTVKFDLATVNHGAAMLVSQEQVQLVNSSHTPISTPSSPDSDTDGFNVCNYASTCSAPSSS